MEFGRTCEIHKDVWWVGGEKKKAADEHRRILHICFSKTKGNADRADRVYLSSITSNDPNSMYSPLWELSTFIPRHGVPALDHRHSISVPGQASDVFRYIQQ